MNREASRRRSRSRLVSVASALSGFLGTAEIANLKSAIDCSELVDGCKLVPRIKALSINRYEYSTNLGAEDGGEMGFSGVPGLGRASV